MALLPEQDFDAHLLLGPGDVVKRCDFSIIPKPPLFWKLQVVVYHHHLSHLQLFKPQQCPSSRTHILCVHFHHAILWVTADMSLLTFGTNTKKSKQQNIFSSLVGITVFSSNKTNTNFLLVRKSRFTSRTDTDQFQINTDI